MFRANYDFRYAVERKHIMADEMTTPMIAQRSLTSFHQKYANLILITDYEKPNALREYIMVCDTKYVLGILLIAGLINCTGCIHCLHLDFISVLIYFLDMQHLFRSLC